ncbi:hypothetical protein COUCH_22990 [Couchioplanes caeruleus]|uniref:hypothetical protein n=1 Tax=Couchioplanes caeruleus TaxID=56438 RepID=UPI0020BE115A|nr:hypothetical protein [Couchioplanes caeruleus]UQU61905.1 hypothetical protein COUCH_22990 [Couchioplanes caeruleus]
MTSQPAILSRSHHRPARLARAAGRSVAFCAVLLPASVVTVLLASTGRSAAAVRSWRRLRVRVLGRSDVDVVRQPGTARVIGHGLVGALLGLAALVPLGVEALFVMRGVLYGFVDPGPYDHSWGGPGKGGAWAVHFLVGLLLSPAGFLMMAGIAAVQDRLTLRLLGHRIPRWVTAAATVLTLGAAAFVVAWSRQI